VCEMTIDSLAKTVLAATRKGFFRQKPVFMPHSRASSDELLALEKGMGVVMPDDLRAWLVAVGYGDLSDQLSFRKEWIAPIEIGQLKGGARFAQDVLGNFYAFGSSGGTIYYLARSEAVFAPIATSFLGFIEELVRRDYDLANWIGTLETQKYEW
jgi:hypothetical protein